MFAVLNVEAVAWVTNLSDVMSTFFYLLALVLFIAKRPWPNRAIAILLLFPLSMPAAAQLRTVPSGAERGVLSHVSGMMFELNGERIQMGSGAQIRDASNRIVLPGMLPPESLVKYTLDHEGHIHRVWILTPEEAARPDEEKK